MLILIPTMLTTTSHANHADYDNNDDYTHQADLTFHGAHFYPSVSIS